MGCGSACGTGNSPRSPFGATRADASVPNGNTVDASYSANAWNAGSGWPCGSDDAKSGPALVIDFAGTPTPYGQGYRDHLLSLK